VLARRRLETMAKMKAEAGAFAHTMSNEVRFRAVLVP
jgi:hypothetical protein